MRWPLSFVLLLSLSAVAEAPKPPARKLYVRVKNARVLEQPNLKATPIAELQPGAEVTWLGADPTVKQLHKVAIASGGAAAPREGWMLQATLSARLPTPEYLTDDGKPIDSQAFASSGAATKTVGGMAHEYAQKKNLESIVRELETGEAISRAVSPEAVSARARTLGLAAIDAEPAPAAAAPAAAPTPKKKKKKGATR